MTPAQPMIPKITLSDLQIQKLIADTGYGVAPEKVELLIIGNESGTNGEKSESDFIENRIGANVVIAKGKKPTPVSPMLQFVNRLRLFISEEPSDKWFNKKADTDPEDYKRIVSKDFLGDNVHLMDIRPFPRATEANWNYANISCEDYLKAFDVFNIHAPWPLGDYVSNRQKVLKNKIEEFANLKYIVAPGAPGMKINFLKMTFPQIAFEEKTGNSIIKTKKGEKRNTYYLATSTIGSRKVKIVVSNFFNNQNGIRLSGLNEVSQLLLTD